MPFWIGYITSRDLLMTKLFNCETLLQSLNILLRMLLVSLEVFSYTQWDILAYIASTADMKKKREINIGRKNLEKFKEQVELNSASVNSLILIGEEISFYFEISLPKLKTRSYDIVETTFFQFLFLFFLFLYFFYLFIYF